MKLQSCQSFNPGYPDSDKFIKQQSCKSLNPVNPDSDKILYFVKTRFSHIKISVIEGIKNIYVKNNVLIKYIQHLRSPQSILYHVRFI